MSESIERVFDGGGAPDDILTRLMPALCEALDCDRCVLFPRNPRTQAWTMSHAWQARQEFAIDRPFHKWSVPAGDEGETDPMFAQAMISDEVLFIADVLIAPREVVNAAFELENYGNRSLAHAPIYLGDDYYGLFEPCTIGRPHNWTPERRRIVWRVQELIAPVVSAYVEAHGQ